MIVAVVVIVTSVKCKKTRRIILRTGAIVGFRFAALSPLSSPCPLIYLFREVLD